MKPDSPATPQRPLDCPFCGGEASFGTSTIQRQKDDAGNYGTFTGHFVNCIICGVCNKGIAEGFRTPEAAAEKWNRRFVESETTLMPPCGAQPDYPAVAGGPPPGASSEPDPELTKAGLRSAARRMVSLEEQERALAALTTDPALLQAIKDAIAPVAPSAPSSVALTVLTSGGECSTCGFRYFEHKEHIIPCPRCQVERLLTAEQERLLLASEDEIRREILADGRDPEEYLRAVDKVMKLTTENALLKHDLEKALANHAADSSAAPAARFASEPVAWQAKHPGETYEWFQVTKEVHDEKRHGAYEYRALYAYPVSATARSTQDCRACKRTRPYEQMYRCWECKSWLCGDCTGDHLGLLHRKAKEPHKCPGKGFCEDPDCENGYAK